MIDNKKRRHGPAPMPTEEKRSHCVSVRLNADELRLVDFARKTRRRGEYLRRAALGRTPIFIPEVNANLRNDLGKIGSNLNQLQRSINSGQVTIADDKLLAELLEVLSEVKLLLVGVGEGT
jgi:hypothetical protein